MVAPFPTPPPKALFKSEMAGSGNRLGLCSAVFAAAVGSMFPRPASSGVGVFPDRDSLGSAPGWSAADDLFFADLAWRLSRRRLRTPRRCGGTSFGAFDAFGALVAFLPPAPAIPPARVSGEEAAFPSLDTASPASPAATAPAAAAAACCGLPLLPAPPNSSSHVVVAPLPSLPVVGGSSTVLAGRQQLSSADDGTGSAIADGIACRLAGSPPVSTARAGDAVAGIPPICTSFPPEGSSCQTKQRKCVAFGQTKDG